MTRADGLARGLAGLQLLAGLSSLLWGFRCGVAGLHQCCWGSSGRLPPPGGVATRSGGHVLRAGHVGIWRGPDSDPSHAVGIGLQTGEEEASHGQWFGLEHLGGSRPLGSVNTEPYDTNSTFHDIYPREENEVCLSAGPGRRKRIHCGLRDTEGGLAESLRGQNGMSTPRTGGTHDRTTFSTAEEDSCWRTSLRRLFNLVALWEKSPQGTPLPKLPVATRRHMADARSPWPLRLWSVAGELPGVQSRTSNAGSGESGNTAILRVLHREDGQVVSRCMASSGCSGRPSSLRASPENESADTPRHLQRHEGTAPLGREKSMGSLVQVAGARPRLLVRTSSRASNVLVILGRSGNSKDTCRKGSKCCRSWRCRRHETGDRTHPCPRRLSNREVKKCQEKCWEEKEATSRQAGARTLQGEGQSDEGKRQGQRQDTTVLCLEQQQWGLCWLTTRLRLPRKHQARTPLHKMWKPRSSFSPMLFERKLIFWLKLDWAATSGVSWTKVPLVLFVKETKEERKQTGTTKEEVSGSSKEPPKQPPEGDGEGNKEDRPEVATFNGREMTLEEFTRKRRFRVLHHYAGTNDPLSKAIKLTAEVYEMKVEVVTCEKKAGVDLLASEPFDSHCDQARGQKWDAYHSGFPCTTFSKLRWNKRDGYPGPVRSKREPYGFKGNSSRQQAECDEGTLHASRSAFIADLILSGRKNDPIKPAVTLENPPPSDNPDHLSAWELEEIAAVVNKHNFTEANFPTCMYQRMLANKDRFFKPQLFKGTLLGLGSLSGVCTCNPRLHRPIQGKQLSELSGEYPEELCEAYAKLLFDHFKKIAAMEFYRQREEEMEEKLAKLRALNAGSATTPGESSSREATPSKRPLTQSLVDKTAAKKAKPTKDSPAEYTYECETETSSSGDKTLDEDPKTPPTKTRPRSPSPPPAPAKRAKKEEEQDKNIGSMDTSAPAESSSSRPSAEVADWRGGSGDYGMLRDSKAKSKNPALQNYLGGMRNPCESVKGMPTALSLGMRIFAAWERFTKSNPTAMETAAAYGSPDCELDQQTVERWRAELRKLVGSRGKRAIQLRSKWMFQTPLQQDLFEAWTRKSGDPDIEVAKWLDEGTPLGINRRIVPRGIFPPNDKTQEEESLVDALAQLGRGSIANYASVREAPEDALIEVNRLKDKGIVTKVSRQEVEEHFGGGTISKLALIVKQRPDNTKKRRLIIDLRRSGGNSKADLEEKLILPRIMDGVGTLKDLYKFRATPTGEQEEQHWRREMLLLDVSDAFPHLGVHSAELQHCLTPHVESGSEDFLLLRALLFGFKTAPLIWSRLASWVARSLQACIPHQEGQHQVYLDDSFWVLQGTLMRRNLLLGFLIYTMAALGLSLSLSKGERGDKVTWAGVEFRLQGTSSLLLTLPEKFIVELLGKMEPWKRGGMGSLRDLRAVCGKVSWLSGVLLRTKWILRVFYAVLTEREKEISSGQEEAWRRGRSDSRNKEHLFPIKRLERARASLVEFLKVTKERPTRKISLQPRAAASITITTDASPEGLGAVLVVNNQAVEFLHSPVTEIDAKDLGFELGSSASQGIVEALALVMALDRWGSKLSGTNVELKVQSDSITALCVLKKVSAAGPTLNFIGAVLAILLEKYGVEAVALQHIPGVANEVADYLSRPSSWESKPKPQALQGREISTARGRGGDFYPLEPPGRQPDLWGSSQIDDESGSWLSWL